MSVGVENKRKRAKMGEKWVLFAKKSVFVVRKREQRFENAKMGAKLGVGEMFRSGCMEGRVFSSICFCSLVISRSSGVTLQNCERFTVLLADPVSRSPFQNG